MNITVILAWVTVLTEEPLQLQFKPFLSGYLKNQHTLVIFKLNDQNNDHRLNILHKMFAQNSKIGIEIWKITNKLNQLEFHDMGEGIGNPSIIKSYAVFVDLVNTFLGFLFKFSKINANGKWIFIFDNHTLDEVEFVFEEAWNKHKMLNILGVIFIDQKVQFCLYNPFQFNAKEVRGVFNYFKFDEWNRASKIYNNRLNNLYKYPIKTHDKDSFRYPVYNHNNKIYRYRFTDGTILTCLKQAMNFKFDFLSKKSVKSKYLRSIKNLTKLAALIDNKIIDISSKSKFVTLLDTENTAFLQPMNFVELCYVVSKHKNPINYLLMPLDTFDAKTKFITIVTMIVLIIVWSLIEFIRSKIGQNHDSIADILLIISQVHCLASIPHFSKYNNRAILIVVVFFFFIICNTYQGIIASRFVLQPQAKEINTLEELDKSGLNVLSTVTGVFRPTQDDIISNSIFYRLSKKPTTFVKTKTLNEILLNTTFKDAILTKTKNANIIIPKFFDRRTGRYLYRIVQEKLLKLHQSYMIPTKSPYRERFAEILSRLIEFGFVQFAIAESKVSTQYIERTKAGFGEEQRVVVIKMKHLDPLIVLWVLCILVSTIVFILEISSNCIKKRIFKC